MPLRDYVCDQGHTTELLYRGALPRIIECEVCGAEARPTFPLIAKPTPIDHMGKYDPHTGRVFTSNTERTKYYESQGLVHSTDLDNPQALLDDQVHETLAETESIRSNDLSKSIYYQRYSKQVDAITNSITKEVLSNE